MELADILTALMSQLTNLAVINERILEAILDIEERLETIEQSIDLLEVRKLEAITDDLREAVESSDR